MTIRSFKEFVQNLVVEELHPELKSVITSASGYVSKQSQLAKKIKQITSRGESTGIEGNMPKGSSRAYLKHAEKTPINVDGHETSIHTGTKVAIKATLDAHHNHREHDGLRLGAMQNKAEGGDHWVNSNYRILTEGDKKGHFHTNKEGGIFPPLIDHDHEHHEWSHVGHVEDLSGPKFKQLTKTPSHPKGITHSDFVSAMNRFHNRNNGRYWEGSQEKHLDHIDTHPLVQRFQDYHGNTGNSPADYAQKKNMGIWKHPIDGSEHIVARDHGFDHRVEHAYGAARKKQSESLHRRRWGY